MGNLYDYFSAPDDPTALAAFGQGIEEAGLPLLPVKGIDPYVQLGQAESMLTGTPYDDVTSLPRFNRLLSSPEDESRWLVTLTDELRDALAAVRAGGFAEVAETWSHIDEFGGDVPPGELAGFLMRLADLAEEARARPEPHRLYCLMSL
ncbi:hypothetical protein OH786_13895 [Streptomyces atratus]|jgi:hypothetical protein|uniref:Uncharacterized protein n=1 Tax=Streptomyces atratus TaxID=1893 RepID=A0A1K2AK40_STRAR|nr:hypothetical protein [Streptomyces atratus]SFX86839.1 hypothetical protein SAMN02787144_1007109 [Streptomyces atratus]